MGHLIATGIVSLDGYINDASGNFDWRMPDEEVHLFVNNKERGVETYLYGRRTYAVMQFWQTYDPDGDDAMADYARIWQAADKVVFSRTLDGVVTPKTQLQAGFDHEWVRSINGEISIGGPTLAASAVGIIDEYRIFINPVSVGGGTPFFPPDTQLDLELVDEHPFASGVRYLAYRPREN